jgi:hypothetical protein
VSGNRAAVLPPSRASEREGAGERTVHVATQPTTQRCVQSFAMCRVPVTLDGRSIR